MTADRGFESAFVEDNWDGVAAILIDTARGGKSADVEEMLVRLINVGRVHAPAEALRRRGEALPLLLRIFCAEAAGRRVGLSEHELEDLQRDLEIEDLGTDVQMWLSAIHAEHYMWRADLSGFAVGSSALYDHAGTDLGSLGRIGRGRLWRMLGIVQIALSPSVRVAPGPMSELQAFRDAETDLGAAGCTDQIVFGRSLLGITTATLFRESAPWQVEVIRGSVADAAALGSDLLAPQWLMLAWAAILAWDMPMASLALGEAQSSLRGDMFVDMRDAAGAVIDLVDSGGDRRVAEAISGLGERLRRRPLVVQGLSIFLAGVLLDHALAGYAAEYDPSPAASAPMPESTVVDLETIRLRHRLLTEPGSVDFEAVQEIVEANIRANGERVAVSTCLKLAHDCALVGRADDALRLRRHAYALLPANRHSARERFYAERLDALLTRVGASPQ